MIWITYLEVDEETVEFLFAGASVKILTARVEQHTGQSDAKQVFRRVQHRDHRLWRITAQHWYLFQQLVRAWHQQHKYQLNNTLRKGHRSITNNVDVTWHQCLLSDRSSVVFEQRLIPQCQCDGEMVPGKQTVTVQCSWTYRQNWRRSWWRSTVFWRWRTTRPCGSCTARPGTWRRSLAAGCTWGGWSARISHKTTVTATVKGNETRESAAVSFLSRERYTESVFTSMPVRTSSSTLSITSTADSSWNC